MKLFLILAASLFVIFVSATPAAPKLISKDPTPADEHVKLNYFDEQGNAIDPSDRRHDHATLEMWLGGNPTNIGDLLNGDLYNAIWQSLNTTCPDNDHHSCMPGSSMGFATSYLRDDGRIEQGNTTVFIHSAIWTTNQVRKLLFGAIAGAVEGMANEQRNCYDAPDRTFHNVSDRVKVYFPGASMHVQIAGPASKGSFDCCASRAAIDGKVDELRTEAESAFETKGKTYRIVRCIGGTGGC
ncbi:hypothetical protein P153DRAFT_386613 [Dothidotthia symphoricarpi CBS 119687]|uniref:Ecp2 effector protein domain-containing protein n=1 Tax=Dothidotthia symphoricarpi CBS 119687 TaxID=1392245 RepID=A0A6A6ABW4_9PLEO|nr:uncharacterized protein P153DRAFT_386613 [Dothidotthia symphoricarpi CBS 119687]KAF2128494.1 hypothetical protein P153DRAFT_386613 [Dothidotthia symphoricarpi CBS 119687]